MTDGRSFSEEGGSAYLNLILDQVQEERARKESLERRAMWLASVSGTLVVLLFGVEGNRDTNGQLPKALHGVRPFVVVSLIGLACAIILALLATRPVEFLEPDPENIKSRIDGEWDNDVREVSKQIAHNLSDNLISARGTNDTKACFLLWAVRCQALAVLILVGSGAAILIGG